jgi:acid phosphatase class B
MRPTLAQLLKHLEELKSDGVEAVRYDIDDLILFLTHLYMKEHGWISSPSSKYLN